MQNETIDAPPVTSNTALPAEATITPTALPKSDVEAPPTPVAPPTTDSTSEKAQAPATEAAMDPTVPEDSLQLRYEVFLTAGREQVLRVKSMIEFPMALDLENLAQTDVNFPEVLDRILIQPVTTKFRAYLQKRFEVASRIAAEKEAAAKPPPPPVQPSFTIQKPANRTDIVLPEMKVTPPPPRMPGGFAPSFPGNGT